MAALKAQAQYETEHPAQRLRKSVMASRRQARASGRTAERTSKRLRQMHDERESELAVRESHPQIETFDQAEGQRPGKAKEQEKAWSLAEDKAKYHGYNADA